MVTPFDAGILHFLNQFAQRSWLFDKTAIFASTDPFVTGGVALAFFWWAWFRKRSDQLRDRQILICGFVTAFVALLLARTLASTLPFRARPYLNMDLQFRPPLGTSEYYSDLLHWSSFPSDHAVLYFSLATSIFLISKRAGLLAYAHALIVVCLPLVYLGEHYPSDILAGALLGIGIGRLSAIAPLYKILARRPLQLLALSPECFYPLMFLCSFLFATNFNSVRKITFYAFHVLIGAHHVEY